MELGRRIAELRKSRHLKQTEFAECYHVSQQTVSSWENGRSYPDLETLIRISEDYSVSLDELIKEDRGLIEEYDSSRSRASRATKAVGVLAAITVLTIIALFIMLDMASKPTSNAERIKMENSIGMTVDLPGMSHSRAITYTLEGSISDEHVRRRMDRIKTQVMGKVEGDIPAAYTGDYIVLHFQDPYYIDQAVTAVDDFCIECTDVVSGKILELNPVTEISDGNILARLPQSELDFSSSEETWYECFIIVGFRIEGADYVSFTGLNLFERK